MNRLSQRILVELEKNFEIEKKSIDDSTFFEPVAYFLKSKGRLSAKQNSIVLLKDTIHFDRNRISSAVQMRDLLDDLSRVHKILFGNLNVGYIILFETNQKVKPPYYFNGVNMFAHLMAVNTELRVVYFDNDFHFFTEMSVRKLSRMLQQFQHLIID